MVRCKFRVLGVERTWDGFEVVRLAPVSGTESEENRMFWSATPSGEARIRVAEDSAAFGRLAAKACVYLDLVDPAEEVGEAAIMAPLVYLAGRTEGWGWYQGGPSPADVTYEFTPVPGTYRNDGHDYDDPHSGRAWGRSYGGLTYRFSTGNRAVDRAILPATVYRLVVRPAV